MTKPVRVVDVRAGMTVFGFGLFWDVEKVGYGPSKMVVLYLKRGVYTAHVDFHGDDIVRAVAK